MPALFTLAAGAVAAPARNSIWDGVYTDAQAERGHTLYMQSCARCHGADLSGTFEIPPLVGRFMPYWSGSSLDALFDYVSTAMPLSNLGSLSAAANADIVAFLLKSNDIPSGAKELGSGQMKTINFDPAKPVGFTVHEPDVAASRSRGPLIAAVISGIALTIGLIFGRAISASSASAASFAFYGVAIVAGGWLRCIAKTNWPKPTTR